MLTAAGVLELVHQQVANAVGESDCSVAGKPVFAFENAFGNLRDFDEVYGRGLGEDDFELGGGKAKKGEAGANDLPVGLRVADRRERADGGQCRFQARKGVETGDQIEEARLLRLAVGGKTKALVDRLAKGGIAREQEIGEAMQYLMRALQFFPGMEGRAGKLGNRGQRAMDLSAGLRAGEAGQLESFFTGTRNLSKQEAELGERLVDSMGEGALQVGAQRIPVGRLAEDEVMHPPMTLGEHINKQIFDFLPIVIAPLEELLDGSAGGRASSANLAKGGSGGAAVKVAGLLGDVQTSSEAEQYGLLRSQVAAKGIDGRDAELGWQIEQLPCALLGASEGPARDRAWHGGAQLIEDAVAHFCGGGVGEGDGNDLAGVVDLG